MAEQEKKDKIKKPKRKRRILRKIIVALLCLCILGGAGYYAYSSLKQEYTITYTGYKASIGSISNSLSFSGSLSLINSKTYTSDADTTVRAIYVTAGAEVNKGDKLIKLGNGNTIKADFAGRVNTLSVAVDDDVSMGASLIQIADFSRMKVNVRVDEYDIGSVAVGQACTVTATATEKVYDSTIAAIDYISASSGNVAYYTATVYVNVTDSVYPGMQATVSIPKDSAENVIILKKDALSFDATNNAYVYQKDAAGELQEVAVEVGVSNGNYVEIKSGLKDGDEVFVEVQTEAASSGLGGLLSGLLGGQQTMPSGGGSGMPDFSSMDFSNFDTNSMPSSPSGGGMPGGFGGGRQ